MLFFFLPIPVPALYQVNNNGWSALIWCAINGCEEVATALLSASANYLTADNEGRSRRVVHASYGMSWEPFEENRRVGSG
jgi:hypothetical protein